MTTQTTILGSLPSSFTSQLGDFGRAAPSPISGQSWLEMNGLHLPPDLPDQALHKPPRGPRSTEVPEGADTHHFLTSPCRVLGDRCVSALRACRDSGAAWTPQTSRGWPVCSLEPFLCRS